MKYWKNSNPVARRCASCLGVRGREERRRPAPEIVLIRGRHAEQLGDDRDGQGIRELRDEVHSARITREGGRDEVLRNRGDAATEALDDLRREGLGHERAEPRMVRRIGAQHVLAERLELARYMQALPLLGGPFGEILSEARIAQHVGAIGVSREEPEWRLAIGLEDPRDGLFGPEALVDGVGVLAALQREQGGHGRRMVGARESARQGRVVCPQAARNVTSGTLDSPSGLAYAWQLEKGALMVMRSSRIGVLLSLCLGLAGVGIGCGGGGSSRRAAAVKAATTARAGLAERAADPAGSAARAAATATLDPVGSAARVGAAETRVA